MLEFTPEAWARMFSREDDTTDCTHKPRIVVTINPMSDETLPDGAYGVHMRHYNQGPGWLRVKDGLVVAADRKCRWAKGGAILQVRDFIKRNLGTLSFQKAEQ